MDYKFPDTRVLLDVTAGAGGGTSQGPVFVILQMCKRLGWTWSCGGRVDNGFEAFDFWEVDGPTLDAMVHDAL